MNNGAKEANIMTWSKFKKLFEPEIYSRTDFLGGKMIVEPTMTSPNLRFMHRMVLDLDEHYNYNPPKPLQIVRDMIDTYKYTYVVYYVWRHRDFHGRSMDIFYK